MILLKRVVFLRDVIRRQQKSMQDYPVCKEFAPASSNLCFQLITVANSLDLDQARQDVGPDLDPNCLTLRVISCKKCSKKLILKKDRQTTKKHAKLPSMQRVNFLTASLS